MQPDGSKQRWHGRAPTTKFSRLLREDGWSTAQLADATGYSEAAIRSWRRGVRVPSRGALLLLAQILKRDAAALSKLMVHRVPAR